MRTAEGECAFCRIARGLDPAARIVWRDASTVAFFPDHPATAGHTLVIPTEHASMIHGLSPEASDALFRRVVSLSPVIAAAVGAEGFNLIQSNGAAAEQTVPHVHVHVLPRWNIDRMGAIWPDPATELPSELIEEKWHQVKEAVDHIEQKANDGS